MVLTAKHILVIAENLQTYIAITLQKTLALKTLSQKCLSNLGSFIWNGLPDDAKMSNNVNTFKHKVKRAS